jgi:hypothetical protein
MASLYPLDSSFIYRFGKALSSVSLGRQIVDFLNFSGERTQVTIIAGGSAGSHAVPGLEFQDRPIALWMQDSTSGVITDLTSEIAGWGSNTINNSGGTDSTGNTLIVHWGDRTP